MVVIEVIPPTPVGRGLGERRDVALVFDTS
jgi:hypothetical protein